MTPASPDPVYALAVLLRARRRLFERRDIWEVKDVRDAYRIVSRAYRELRYQLWFRHEELRDTHLSADLEQAVEAMAAVTMGANLG